MKPKVYIASPIPKEVEAYIAAYCEYRKWEHTTSIPRERLLQEINDAEGLLTGGHRVDTVLLDHAPHLKVISNIAVGYNNFDLNAMKYKGIMGTNTPYVLDDTVADLVLGMILAAARRIPELDRYVKAGQWEKGADRQLYGADVHHAVMGIIGMGRIGEKIAKRAKFGFDMEVLYYNRSRKKDTEQKLGVEYRSMEALLQQSDYVVLMTPLTPETTRFIGRNEFKLMKKNAIFINASRGQTVDEQALIEALQQGTIQGAALDVFEKEPVSPDNPLLQMTNVVTLPHIGSATGQTRLEMAFVAARNLVAGVTGQTPPNVVEELKCSK